MRTTHFFTDVYGPRLTGSPNARRAAEWALRQMALWGMRNGRLEPWDFGHDGWANLRASGYVVSPLYEPLTFKVTAWTPSTRGPVRGQAVMIDPPENPAGAELARFLAAQRGRVRGKIVMVGKGAPAPAPEPVPYRLDDKTMAGFLKPAAPPPRSEPKPGPAAMTAREVNQAIDAFLVASGALMRVDDAGQRNGLIIAARNATYETAKAPPSVTLRNEDYARIARILADGSPVTLEFDIRNAAYPEGRTSFNTIAEIPGSDRADEVVMIGAHLDSWHLATGATDDAIGCAMVMEAARILLAVGVQPRRTIRVALWTGEEQGLLGSQHYVAQHFGTVESPLPDFGKLKAYINLDSGTGRIRGMNVFGPPEDAAILAKIVEPLADLGPVGAVAHRIRRLRGTDATTFSRAGLPAIGVLQDPIEYGNLTWHSNLDTYERVLEQDAKEAAIVLASVSYALAMAEENLPRFSGAEMPSPEGPPPALRPPHPASAVAAAPRRLTRRSTSSKAERRRR